MNRETREQIKLAKRLGMPSLAEHIERRNSVYIVPTAKAYYALKALGMLEDEREDPPQASLGFYR